MFDMPKHQEQSLSQPDGAVATDQCFDQRGKEFRGRNLLRSPFAPRGEQAKPIKLLSVLGCDHWGLHIIEQLLHHPTVACNKAIFDGEFQEGE